MSWQTRLSGIEFANNTSTRVSRPAVQQAAMLRDELHAEHHLSDTASNVSLECGYTVHPPGVGTLRSRPELAGRALVWWLHCSRAWSRLRL